MEAFAICHHCNHLPLGAARHLCFLFPSRLGGRSVGWSSAHARGIYESDITAREKKEAGLPPSPGSPVGPDPALRTGSFP